MMNVSAIGEDGKPRKVAFAEIASVEAQFEERVEPDGWLYRKVIARFVRLKNGEVLRYWPGI